jgi:hypothetical protein
VTQWSGAGVLFGVAVILMSLAVKLAEARAQRRAEAAERNAENQHVLANIGALGVENAVVLERILSSVL